MLPTLLEKIQEVLSTCAAGAVHSMSFFLYIVCVSSTAGNFVQGFDTTNVYHLSESLGLIKAGLTWPQNKDELSTFEGPSKTLTWWRKINVFSLCFTRFPMFNYNISYSYYHIIVSVAPTWALQKMFMSFFTRRDVLNMLKVSFLVLQFFQDGWCHGRQNSTKIRSQSDDFISCASGGDTKCAIYTRSLGHARPNSSVATPMWESIIKMVSFGCTTSEIPREVCLIENFQKRKTK